jgi:hypothetical protein
MAATLLLQGMRTTSKKLLPSSTPPLRKDPGEFMLKKAESLLPPERREQIPDLVEQAAVRALQMGYGMTSGLLYGVARPRGGNPILEGTLLGLGVWAAGYLGWLPAADLMPPIAQQEPQQIAVPLVEHALFGIAVVAAYDAMAQ